MMTTTQSIMIILVVTFGTMLTRFLPFLVFHGSEKPPRYIQYLGKVLPYAVMSLLIVFCLKDAVFTWLHGLPEVIGIVAVVILHKWKKQMLLSIGGGTILYMLLVQFVF